MNTGRFTMDQLKDCAEREVRQRERVYPRRIAEGRMTEAFAKEQIDMMRTIADYFTFMAAMEKSKTDLFGGQ